MTSRKLFGIAGLALLTGAAAGCASAPDGPLAVKADQPFVKAGHIEMQLDGGNYEIRAASDDHVRVSFGGNPGNATTDLSVNGGAQAAQATLTVRNTPHNNFRAAIEVPKTSDLVLHLTGGNLEIAPISGNKDVDSKAGNVEIAVSDPNDYASVDASVKVGNLDAGPFGESRGGLSPHFTWTGRGKYTLRASLGAGNLELKR
ncbi:MAG: hypothetical protein JOZ22_21955 [Acidobacteriia bacterium]|nr:hypothetical protein [Terriglobia bacterium]